MNKTVTCSQIHPSSATTQLLEFDHRDFTHPNHLVLKYLQYIPLGWLGEAMVSCILRHRGVQLILAYSWDRTAVLSAGKGSGGCYYFFCFFTFIYFLFSLLFLSFISSTIPYITFLPFSGRRHKMTHKG